MTSALANPAFPSYRIVSQDILGIRKVKNVDVIYLDFSKSLVKSTTAYYETKKKMNHCKVGVGLHNFLSNEQQIVGDNSNIK